uniref:Uncharacterized protein n=1 Tax=Oryza barthii TaxID=65489 RepID=A0A0D3HX20_9ORYZ
MGLLSIIRKIKRKEKVMRILMVLFEHMGCGWTEDNPIVFEQANCLRLAGVSLFVLANKQDNQGALKPAEIAKAVCSSWMPWMAAGILID